MPKGSIACRAPNRRGVLGMIAGAAAVVATRPARAWTPGGEVIDVTAAPYNANPGLADNTTAFQNALNALVAAGGGLLRVPAGYYKIGSPLTINSNVSMSIFGDNEEISVLIINHTGVGLTYTTTYGASTLTLRDLGFQAQPSGSSAGAVAVNGIARTASGWPTCTIENCDFGVNGGSYFQTVLNLNYVFNSRISGCNYHQASAGASTFINMQGTCINNFVDQCHVDGLFQGIVINAYGEGLHVTNSTILANGTMYGVGLSTGITDYNEGGLHLNYNQIFISDCEFDCTGLALLLFQVKDAQIQNSHFATAGQTYGVAIGIYGGQEAQFQNCYVSGVSDKGSATIGFYLGTTSAGTPTYNTEINNITFENVSTGIYLAPGTYATSGREIRLFGLGFGNMLIGDPTVIGSLTWQAVNDQSGSGNTSNQVEWVSPNGVGTSYHTTTRYDFLHNH